MTNANWIKSEWKHFQMTSFNSYSERKQLKKIRLMLSHFPMFFFIGLTFLFKISNLYNKELHTIKPKWQLTTVDKIARNSPMSVFDCFLNMLLISNICIYCISKCFNFLQFFPKSSGLCYFPFFYYCIFYAPEEHYLV